MTRKALNRSLHAARASKQDEFYTQLSDIERELNLKHYQKHFKNKTVLCNCDDPRVSNFFKYFINNFDRLGLKKLIATCYQNDKPDLFSQHKSDKGIYFEYSGFDPELSIRVSYDDVDWDIGPVNEEQIAQIPSLARTAYDHLQEVPLRDAGVTRIAVGMIRHGANWYEPNFQEWPENTRFWGISLQRDRAITHLYDTETCLLAERPRPSSEFG